MARVISACAWCPGRPACRQAEPFPPQRPRPPSPAAPERWTPPRMRPPPAPSRRVLPPRCPARPSRPAQVRMPWWRRRGPSSRDTPGPHDAPFGRKDLEPSEARPTLMRALRPCFDHPKCVRLGVCCFRPVAKQQQCRAASPRGVIRPAPTWPALAAPGECAMNHGCLAATAPAGAFSPLPAWLAFTPVGDAAGVGRDVCWGPDLVARVDGRLCAFDDLCTHEACPCQPGC